jgi:iron complex outermembrane receptor protein
MVMHTLISHAQLSTIKATIIDEESNLPLIGATMLLEESGLGNISDIEGVVTFDNQSVGRQEVLIAYLGYSSLDTLLTIGQGHNEFTFYLHPEGEELEEVVVRATRSTRTVQNIPTRIEFIGAEELEEKAIMNAANISLVLRESTGIQIQQTSLSSGNSTIRIQGLDGRYTQLLKDGFPLYGGFSGGLSIMQIPPLDLAQFEIIKGSNSTLYGGGAIAGLVNMVSIEPDDEHDLDILLAQTHTGGSTGNIFYSDRKGKFGYTLYGAAHYNSPYNPDDDVFTNIPLTKTFSINPKLFYYPTDNSFIWLGINATTDSREGGDIGVIRDDESAENRYVERNISDRISSQLVYKSSFDNGRSLEFKNSISYFNRDQQLPDYSFSGDEVNSFTELNYSSVQDKYEWILGANFYTTNFNEDRTLLPRDIYQSVGGLFANSTYDINHRFIIEPGLRLDYSPNYGLFPLPRLSLLWKGSDKFSSRIGGGLGYKLPDLFTEDAALLNFENILPLAFDDLTAEKSYGFNLDLNYRTPITEQLFVSINQLFYLTQINDALLLEQADISNLQFTNAAGSVQSQGLETNIKFSYHDFRWFLNYAYINTELKYLPASPQKPRTPRHNAGSVLMYENDEWRIGYETYYVGSQLLSDGSSTKDFVTMGFLFQKHFDWGSPYINFENFTDRRQSRYSPEVVGSSMNPSFQEIYAPTDGFVFTAGIHFKPFGREHHHDH